MALARRTGKGVTTSIWTGFVDAMTGLLLVLTFVLTMFAIVHFVLSGMISTQTDELAALDQRIARLNLTISEGDRERERLNLQILRLTEDIGQRDGRIAELEFALQGTELDLAAAIGELEARLALINQLTSDRERGIAEIGDLQGQLTDIRAALAETVRQVEALVAEQAELTGRLSDSGEANRLVAEDRARIAALLAEANAESARLVDEAAAADLRERGHLADIESLRQALVQAEGERDQGSKRIVDLLADLERAAEQLVNETSRADTAEAERLRALADIAALQEALGAATRESEARLAEILSYETRVAGLEQRVATLVQQKLDEENRHSATLEELKAARQENEVLLARADEVADDLIAMDFDLAAKREEAEEALTLLAAAELARTELEKSLDALQKEFKSTVEQLTAMTSEREAALARQRALETDLTNRQSELDRTVRERDEASGTLASLDGGLKAANEEIAGLRAARDDFAGQLAAANRDLEAGAEARAGLQSQLAAKDDEIQAAAGEVELLRKRLSGEQAMIERLEAGLKAANDEIVKLRTARDDAESRLAAANRDLELGASERTELERQLAGKETEHRAATANVERQRVQLEEARTSLAQAERDNQDIRAQLDLSREEGRAAVEESARLAEAVNERDRRIAILSQEQEQGNIQLESIKSQIEAAAELRSILEATRRELQRSLERAEEELEASRKESQRIPELSRELDESRLRISELEQRGLDSAAALKQAEDRSNASEIQLGIARDLLKQREGELAEHQRQVTVLNLQLDDLRDKLAGLQAILDDTNQQIEQQRADKEIEIASLGTQLNDALAQVAAEKARNLRLEEAERKRLEAQNKELEGFRSEFLGRLRTVIEGKEGVRIDGDRFVFASEVLFPVGKAELSDDGKEQIRSVAKLILNLAGEFPASIDWVLRVDGHTDDRPIIEQRDYVDNWELSQARSLSVVRFLTSELGFPEKRLAAAGFGEHRPVNPDGNEAARSQNRRIEFKLTEP